MRNSIKIAGILLIALTGCSTWDEEFEGDVVRAYPQASIHNKRMAAYEEMTKTLKLIESTMIYERKLEDSFERMQRND